MPLVGGAEAYAAAFDGLTREAPVPAAVQALRQEGFDRFTTLGFPTTRNEDWHYTSVGVIAEQEFALLSARTDDVQASQLAPYRFADERWPTIVVVNGVCAPSLSDLGGLPAGVRVESLATAWASVADDLGRIASMDHAFTALNTAFLQDGVVIDIAAESKLAAPIHIMYVTDATAAKGQIHPRTLIRAGVNSSASIVESYVSISDATHFTNAVTEVVVERGANLSHYKIQREGLRAYHVGTIDVRQDRDSHYQ